MATLTPAEASLLASGVYSRREGAKVPDKYLPENFSFNFNKGARIEGQSGGVLWLKKTTGFGMVGRGTGVRSKQAIFVARGTEMTSGHDWLSNAQMGLKASPNDWR